MDMMRDDDKVLTLREQFVDACLSRVGYPYRWGGQDDTHFDCSGLVVWAMKAIGRPIPDTTSAGLYDLYHTNKCLPDVAPIGSLYFYASQKGGSISHVMVVARIWDNCLRILIGARGGNSMTTTDRLAYMKGAMVDVVTADYWKSNFVLAVDPFLHL